MLYVGSNLFNIQLLYFFEQLFFDVLLLFSLRGNPV